MPKILMPIQGTKESFSRPVVAEVVRELITWTGLPRDIRIQFPGDKEVMHQPGSSIDPMQDFNYSDEATRLFVKYDEEHVDEEIVLTNVFRPNWPHFFRDDGTRTYMRPVYNRKKFTIRIRYQANDIATANKWRDELITRLAHGRNDRYHNLTGSYHIPKEFLVILNEIHRLRENVEGDGKTAEEYLRAYSATGLTQVTDQAGKNKEWVIRETQNRINGYFDFEEPDKPRRSKDGTTFEIEFDYVIILNKPSFAVMMYEVMIHNQLIGPGYRDNKGPETQEKYEVSFSMKDWLFKAWENYNNTMNLAVPGRGYPDYDQWVPAIVFPNTLRIFTGLTSVDMTDRRTLLNLREIGPYKLTDSVIRYIQRNRVDVGKINKTLICVSVYEHEDPLSDHLFEIDEDLNVRLTNDADLTKIYHVRVSIFTNPYIMPSAAIDDLCTDYEGTVEMLSVIMPQCLAKFPLENIEGMISRAQLNLTLQCRYKKVMTFSTAADQVYWFLVQTLIVHSHRKEN